MFAPGVVYDMRACHRWILQSATNLEVPAKVEAK